MIHATAKWWKVSRSHHKEDRPEGDRGDTVHPDRSDMLSWTLIEDPSGDYTPGKKFSTREIKYMQRLGTLDEGAVYECNGVRYVVSGGRLEREQ